MKFEWNESKNASNIKSRELDFADATEMFAGPMLTSRDTRKHYGEIRHIGIGYVQTRLMVVVFTERPPNIIRIISFRKANKREQTKFEKAIKNKLGAH